MLKTLEYPNNRPVIVNVDADAKDIIQAGVAPIGTDAMVDWLKPQGACLYSTTKGLRIGETPSYDGPEAA